MNFSYIDGAHSIQLEISTKCNALCPGCIRTDSRNLKYPNPAIPKNKEMSADMFSGVLNSTWCKSNLQHLEFCGTMDEPFMHSEFLQFLDLIFQTHPKISVHIHTNGGARTPSFYADLAKSLSRLSPNSHVRFSIDGIGKTNQIYRRGVDYEKVLENLQAFVRNGGKAVWQSLVFPWNEHQIHEMKFLAQRMGCIEFYARPDRTFVSELGEEGLEKIRLENPESKSEMKAGNLDYLDFVERNYSKSVNCIYKDQRKMIFISWDGNVWPCCFWTHARYENKIKKQRFESTINSRYEKDFNSLHMKSFDDILSSSLFSKDLIYSWNKNTDLKWRCVEKCSTEKKRSSDGMVDKKNHFLQERLN